MSFIISVDLIGFHISEPQPCCSSYCIWLIGQFLQHQDQIKTPSTNYCSHCSFSGECVFVCVPVRARVSERVCLPLLIKWAAIKRTIKSDSDLILVNIVFWCGMLGNDTDVIIRWKWWVSALRAVQNQNHWRYFSSRYTHTEKKLNSLKEITDCRVLKDFIFLVSSPSFCFWQSIMFWTVASMPWEPCN